MSADIIAQKRVLCVGNAVLDRLFTLEKLPTRGTKTFATGFLEAGGGPAATASVAIACLGGYSCLWSRIGNDSAGDAIMTELAEYGVDLGDIIRLEASSSQASVLVDATGERMSVNYIDPRLPQDSAWIPLEEIKYFDTVLADVRWPAATEAVLKKAAEMEKASVLDADLCPSADILHTLVPLASHVIFSQGGLALYTGVDSPEEGLRQAAKHHSGLVGVTMGPNGCLWLEKETLKCQPAFSVRSVDTTGAGDVFHGSFALFLAEGKPLAECFRLASAVAALKCTRPGGRAGIPDRTGLEAFLQKQH